MEPGKVAAVFLVEGARVLWRAAARTAGEIMAGGRMSRAEAEHILDVGHKAAEDRVQTAFLRMYSANSKENGGSSYVQSKILAAYSVLSDAPHGQRHLPQQQ